MILNRFRIAGLAVVALAAGAMVPVLPSGTASAQTGRVAGDGCATFQQAGGTFWQGFFRGREESPFMTDDGLYDVTRYRCFQTRAECDAWLYDVQSAHVTTSRTWCRQYG